MWEQWENEAKEVAKEKRKTHDKKRACTGEWNHYVDTGEALSLDCMPHFSDEMQTLKEQGKGFWKQAAGRSNWLGMGLLPQGIVLQVLQG